MANKDALLEIGVENLPARFVAPALEQLKEGSVRLFIENHLKFSSARTLGTYKRLSLIIEGVEERSSERTSDVTGPPARLLKDENGNFTKQSAGFARSQGARPEDLISVSTSKGEFLAVRKKIPGEPAHKILSRVFPEVISSLQFPKSMVWEASQFRFARPIRSIVALYGKKTVPFSVAGVKSGRGTTGLSAQGSRPLAITEPGKYIRALENKCVMAEPESRRELLKKSLQQAAARMKLAVDMDEALLEETVFLVEHPVPVAGHFSLRFLKLPGKLLSTVLKKQLKFFPVSGEGGELQPHFIGIRDGVSDGQKEVQEGYESVVEARLSDAVFFFDRDLAVSLEKMRERLKGIVFHEKLGTLYEKTERVEALSSSICGYLRSFAQADEEAVRLAARFCYSDLASEVVREFPELQGTMGCEYAARESVPADAAASIGEFYFPVSSGSPLPSSVESSIVSMAGKIDTLAGDFAAGLIPSGSEDPHGLRRMAAGLVRILLEKNFPVPVRDILARSLEMFKLDSAASDEVRAGLEDFIWQRVQTVFEESGFKFDEIRAVRDNGLDNLPMTFKRLLALHNIRKEPDFISLATAFRRAANILKHAGVKAGAVAPVKEELFKEAAEKELFEKLEKLRIKAEAFRLDAEFSRMLKEMITLKPVVDKFFEDVMVMAEDESVKQNRLNLMAGLVNLFGTAADLSQLQ